MSDAIERELRALDEDRPLPPTLYGRLEAALLEDAAARAGATDDGDAALFDSLDAPRPIPSTTRAALERALTGGERRRDRRGFLLGIAAAVLLVVAMAAALRPGGSTSNRHVAIGPAPSAPEAGVPPVLEAPATTTAPASVGAAANLTPRSSTPARRSTTTTTWDCGLCAKNGAARGSAGAAGSSSGGTWQSTGGPAAPAAMASSTAPPAISTVDPSSGPQRGGTIVTLTGYGFTGASGVRFGSSSAVNFNVVSDTEIKVMAPPSTTRGPVDVVVTFPDGTSTPTGGSNPTYTYT